MTVTASIAFGLLGQWLLGATISTWILRKRHEKRGKFFTAETAGQGIVVGIGLTSLLLFVWSWVGGSLGRATSLSVASMGYAVAAVEAILRRRMPHSPISAGQLSGLTVIARWLVFLLAVSAMVQSLLTPQRLWDERAIFGIKAAVLYYDRTIDSPLLAHPDFPQGHPRYPLLLPLAEAHLYFLAGEMNDRLSKMISPLLYLGMVLSFAGVIQRHLRQEDAWLFAAMLATVPAVMPWEYGFLSAQADAPVACFHGVALLYLWDGLRRSTEPGAVAIRPFLLAGLACGLAIFTKDEGIAMMLVDVSGLAFVLFAVARVPWTRTVRFLASFAVPVGVIVALWFSHRSGLPTTTEMDYFGRLTLDRLASGTEGLKWAIPHLLHRMFVEAYVWGLQWWALLIAFTVDFRKARRPAQMILLCDVLGCLAALLVAGLLAPMKLEDHISGSSHRFLLQLTPTAVLFIAGQWGRPRSAADQNDERTIIAGSN